MTGVPFGLAPRNANARPCDSGATFVIFGGPGDPTIALTASDSRLVPRAFVATAVQEYDRPVASPLTCTWELVLVTDRVAPVVAGRQVRPYDVMGLPLAAPG